jgi:guanine deaminase
MADNIAFRASIFTFNDSVTWGDVSHQYESSKDCYTYIEDGLVEVRDGFITAVGSYQHLKSQLNDEVVVKDYRGMIITPGFIDSHIHANQTGVIGSSGESLLAWLKRYVFPHEEKYEDSGYARRMLDFFLQQLLKNGTTTAMVYGPTQLEGANLLFELAGEKNMRLLAGNVMMDCNVSSPLALSANKNYDHSIQLIERWHQRDRLSYVLSPRFAISSTPELLELTSALKKRYPDVYLQTHLSENRAEVGMVKKLFPDSLHYLDVYYQYGLIDEKAVLGHCLYLTEAELELMSQAKALLSWCPMSNHFLGSGLLDIERSLSHTDRVTLATDVGAGNSFSMFRVMDSAYKVAALQQYQLTALQLWYMATLGAAQGLGIADKVGTLAVGKEADFIILDPAATDLVRLKYQENNDIMDKLFTLLSLADDRHIQATYLMGDCVYQNSSSSAEYGIPC